MQVLGKARVHSNVPLSVGSWCPAMMTLILVYRLREERYRGQRDQLDIFLT